MQLDKPNVELPLAISYNTRGHAGGTNVFTNGLDQRLVNLSFEPIINAHTGKGTLYVVKRPGVSIIGNSYGTSGQVAYLVEIAPSATDIAHWVFSTSGDDVRASSSAATQVIVTAAGYAPAFVDKTAISGADTMVLQIRTGGNPGTYRVFYATAINSWTEITDAVFAALAKRGKMEFMDGFAFQATTNNRIYNPNVNALDTWPANNYITKQIKQDFPTGLMRLGNQIIFLGSSTFEVFRNAGNPTGSPLVSVKEMAQDYGMVNAESAGVTSYYTTCMNRVFWYGTPIGVYSYDGQRVEKVSTPAIDKILTGSTNIYAFSTIEIGQYSEPAVCLALDLTTSSTQRALVFVPRWNVWMEWNSTTFRPVTTWRNTVTFLGVGANQHKLYECTGGTDNWQDNGTNYDRVIQFKLPFSGNDRKFIRWLGLLGTQERSACTESISLSFDDGQTWTSARTFDRTSDKQQLYRFGSGRNVHVRLTLSSNHEGRLEKFLGRID